MSNGVIGNWQAGSTDSRSVATAANPTVGTDPPQASRKIKHISEWLLAFAAVATLVPVGMIIAVAVAGTSRGPVIHRRRVLGWSGTPFDAYKFRTMVEGADAVLSADRALQQEFARTFKIKADPRVTTVGRFLRRYSLDELPQLINVLRGEMALVGPRMISPEELERYGPHQEKLLSVKPGITGLWQTSGRQTTTYEDRVLYDMRYLDEWSLWLDAQILVRTVKTVIKAEGAY